jgi:hypothetical protein
MELDDLKAAWSQLDERLGRIETMAAKNYRTGLLDSSRRALGWLGWCQALQSLLWIGAVAIVAPFWIEHRHVPHLLAAGLVLHAYGVLVSCSSVLQLLLIGRAYWTTPVVLFQRRLTELQRLRVISGLAIGLPWWVMWVPATIVGAKRLFDIDLYAESPGWINASLAVGAVAIVLSIWVARRLAARPPRSRWLRRIVDDIAGAGLVRVTRQLDELAAFERE